MADLRSEAQQLADIAMRCTPAKFDSVARECLISDFEQWLREYDPESEPWDGY